MMRENLIALFNTYLIEHLLYAKHCSGCWGFSSEEKKQKFMPSWDRSAMNTYGMYVCMYVCCLLYTGLSSIYEKFDYQTHSLPFQSKSAIILTESNAQHEGNSANILASHLLDHVMFNDTQFYSTGFITSHIPTDILLKCVTTRK